MFVTKQVAVELRYHATALMSSFFGFESPAQVQYWGHNGNMADESNVKYM